MYILPYDATKPIYLVILYSKDKRYYKIYLAYTMNKKILTLVRYMVRFNYIPFSPISNTIWYKNETKNAISYSILSSAITIKDSLSAYKNLIGKMCEQCNDKKETDRLWSMYIHEATLNSIKKELACTQNIVSDILVEMLNRGSKLSALEKKSEGLTTFTKKMMQKTKKHVHNVELFYILLICIILMSVFLLFLCLII